MVNLTLKNDCFEEIWFNQTPNNSGNFSSPPKYLVMHYTAGTSSRGSRDWLMQSKASASAHLVVGEGEADTFQICSFNKVAWHAGKSFYKGISGLNRHSIGIEVSNAGPLTQDANSQWKTWSGQKVDESKVIIAPHKRGGPARGWMAYSTTQLEWLEELTSVILKNYPSIKEIVGHDDISWPRKTDPGPAFPMGRYQNLLDPRSGGEVEAKAPSFTKKDIIEEDDLFEVTANTLNIRGGPGTTFEKIGAYGPLGQGQLVEVVTQLENGWVFVELVGGRFTGNRGYVYSDYIKRV